MTDNEKNEVALFRYGIISDLVVGNIDTKSKKAFFRDASLKERYYRGKVILVSKVQSKDGFTTIKNMDLMD